MPRNSVRNAVPASSRCNCTPVPRSSGVDSGAALPNLMSKNTGQQASLLGDSVTYANQAKEAFNGRHH